jgi:thiamine-phosphate pyrophosphorylase
VGTGLLLLYYITDRKQFPGSAAEQRERLLAKVAEAARAGVDYIQLREKDLSSRELEGLALAAVDAVRETGSKTRLLINSRTDVSLAVGADGVHLRSRDISPSDVRRIYRSAGLTTEPVVAVSCHSDGQIEAAKAAGADFVVFGPVFGKGDAPGRGIAGLSAACAHGIPVLALGGVNAENASSCLEAGTSGIAGIRLFQQGSAPTTISYLRTY